MLKLINEGFIFIAGLWLGNQFHKVWQAIYRLQNSLLERSKPGIASNDTPIAKIRQREESPFIAEPKSPQQIEYEETEELRKMNPGKF